MRTAALFLALAVFLGAPTSARASAAAPTPAAAAVSSYDVVGISTPRPGATAPSKSKPSSRTQKGSKAKRGDGPDTGDVVVGAAVSWWVYVTYGLSGLLGLIFFGLIVLYLLRRWEARSH